MTTSLLSPALPAAPPMAAPRPAPPAIPTPRAPVEAAALTRFTVAGMLAALDAHAGGRLGSARLCWELSVRLEQLGALHAPASALTLLRRRHRELEHVHSGPGDRASTPGQRQALADALTELRTVLAGITRQLRPTPSLADNQPRLMF